MNRNRERNNNWKGGRVVASNGYVLVKVGVDHHLADVRGYAYEHRVVAERVLGRQLKSDEIVHHIDENKQNNDPSNLKVVAGVAEHFLEHRIRDDLRRPGEDNPIVSCACGCGMQFPKFDESKRPRKYASGHNPPPREIHDQAIWYLQNIRNPAKAIDIASYLDVGRKKITGVMQKLKARKLVHLVRKEWRLGQP